MVFETWEYEEQTKMKHSVVSKYLDLYFTIVGKWNNLNYVDGFSGIGAYTDENRDIHYGSPVRAVLNFEQNHKPKRRSIAFMFIDRDPSNLRNIQQILASLKCETKPLYIEGDFDSVINTVLDKLGNLSPTFMLIDPFGFKGVRIDTVRRIMEQDKTEIVLNFMFTRINEFLSDPKLTAVFDDYFGKCPWQELNKLHGFEREKSLVSLYRNQLKECANVRYVYPYPIEFPGRKRTFYYLFHLTNSSLGCAIMKSVFAELNYNRLAYLGNRSNQMSLSDLSSYKEKDIKKYLVDRYCSKLISFQDLIDEVIDEIPYTEGEIRKTLQKMEGTNIRITRITSKTRKGLRGNDRIMFNELCKERMR
jgi:three-Cys-motif partner protein